MVISVSVSGLEPIHSIPLRRILTHFGYVTNFSLARYVMVAGITECGRYVALVPALSSGVGSSGVGSSRTSMYSIMYMALYHGTPHRVVMRSTSVYRQCLLNEIVTSNVPMLKVTFSGSSGMVAEPFSLFNATGGKYIARVSSIPLERNQMLFISVPHDSAAVPGTIIVVDGRKEPLPDYTFTVHRRVMEYVPDAGMSFISTVEKRTFSINDFNSKTLSMVATNVARGSGDEEYLELYPVSSRSAGPLSKSVDWIIYYAHGWHIGSYDVYVQVISARTQRMSGHVLLAQHECMPPSILHVKHDYSERINPLHSHSHCYVFMSAANYGTSIPAGRRVLVKLPRFQ